MKRKMLAGTTSVSLGVFVQDTSSTTGAGLAITHASSGLVFEYRRQGQSSWTSVTPVTATLGTFTSGGVVADGALTGAIEIGVPDAALAAGARFALVRLRGVTNMLPVLIEMELDAVNYQDATSFGLSRLDGTITSRMASYTQPTGFLAATFPTTVASTTNITSATGVTVATNNDKTGYSLTAITGLGNQTANITGNLSGSVGSVTSGVTVTTNNDKTGYTASTVSDKTGYSLAATTGLGNQTANITGNLSGSVGSVTGAVGSVTSGVTLAAVTHTGAVIPTVTTTTTATNLTNLPSMPAEWITANGIADDALANKGNWNVGKTGYALTATTGLGNQTANITGSLSGSVGSVTGNVGGNVTGSVGSVTGLTTTTIRDAIWNATLASYTTAGTAGLALSDIVSRVTSTVKTMWDNLTSMITGSGASAKYTTTALEDAPGGGGGGGTDWTANERTAIRAILGVPSSGTTPETPTTGVLDAILDKALLITSTNVTSSNPVTSTGQITSPVFIGDDYLHANGRAFSWTIAARSGVTAATATCFFGGSYGTSTWLVQGTVVDNGNSTWTLRFDLPKTITGLLVAGFYAWSVELRNAGGTEITEVASGRNVDVRVKQT